MTRMATVTAALGLALALGACTNPYDPSQRAIGGGLLGAGTGAAIGGLAGGGRGAATGALIGGGLGAVGGAVTTPSPPPRYYEAPPQRGYYYGY
ncbi:Cell envelope biogenesis protein OmpA [Rhodovastum atsumiense]|uniref:Cell envelope biogenesis protein OmpA n=1 Tax=Rhodovastum atsumiense TaxID=504468 RepID=A0A5M6IRY9_9PROT|nr:cell envelope biogenesis protein OmpA [Rhodovastum atsumiense]KAA5610338.1 cell envelope biogenesis protein OmpA [Rhodovastum atsumiense]CAH2600920.1 Cell envelope biogenesis protein OmpA [Rhodovastum atsumiense]